MMKKEIKNLIAALYPYQEELDLDDEQRLDGLQGNVKAGFIDTEHLKLELEEVLSDTNFDWISFAELNSLLLSPSSYNHEEIANYVKSVLIDFLYPDKVLNKGQIDQLQADVVVILKKNSKNDGWMFSYDLYDVLKENEQYRGLEYYNLWKLNFYNSNIERKPIDEKYREIGHLRYKENQLNHLAF